MADHSAFMAGVALMDETLREAERYGSEDPADIWIEAEIRGGPELNLYLRPLVAQLLARPELIDGFSAALGDYLGVLVAGVVPGSGAAYAHLSYEEIMEYHPGPKTPPNSNVVKIRRPCGGEHG